MQTFEFDNLPNVREEAIKQIQRLTSPELISNNGHGLRTTYLARFVYSAR